MISSFVHDVLRLHGFAIYGIVALIVFAEDALLAGLIAPGETAAILGGVAASRGQASVVLMCVVVCVAAILGDATGYLVGMRYGSRLKNIRLLRNRADRVDEAERFLRRRGGPAVFIGRFVAFLRTVIPFLAGSIRMPYGEFAIYNVAGAVLWGIGSVVLGFLVGDSYQTIERVLGPGAAAVAAVVIIAGFIAWRFERHRHASTGAGTDDHDTTDGKTEDRDLAEVPRGDSRDESAGDRRNQSSPDGDRPGRARSAADEPGSAAPTKGADPKRE